MSTENFYPSFPPTPFYYDFKMDKLQYVYVGELYGTTYIIAANMSYVEKKGKKYLNLKDIKGLNMGTIGAIKYAIRSIEPKTENIGRKSKNQKIAIRLDAFQMRGAHIEPLMIELPNDFKIKEHQLVIDIQDQDIEGLDKDAIFLPKKTEANNERSCNIAST